jgi:hypothetical protein
VWNFSHHNSLLLFLCGTQGLHGALPFVSFQPSAFPIVVLFPVCSWSTTLPRTLRVPVQCVSFYCALWFPQCMANPTPFSFLNLSFSRCLFCSLPYNVSFEIFSGHFTFKVCWHQFTNIWNELLTSLVIFHVSHPYNRTDLTFVLINSKLVLTILFLQTGYNSMKAPLGFLI